MKMYTPVATSEGPKIGRIILKNAILLLHPSTNAASSSDMGRSFIKPFSSQTENGSVNVVYASTNAHGVYRSPIFLIMEYNGISSKTVGNILLLKNTAIRILLPLKRYLENAYAAKVEAVSDTIVVKAAAMKLFFIAERKFTVVVNRSLWLSHMTWCGK